MARQGNLFSVLALVDPEALAEDDEQVKPDKPAASSMPSSKKKRRKSKKEPAVVPADSLSLSLAALDLSSSEKPPSLQQQSASSAQDASSSSSSSATASAAAPSSGLEQCLTNGDHSLNPGSVNLQAPVEVYMDNKPAAAALGGLLKWPLVWIDLEMSGLDLEKDRILEIACIITDGKLQKLIEGPDIIINQSEELLAGMGEWCQRHHTANGLVEGVRNSKITEKEAEMEVLNFVRQHTENITKQPLLAGNSVYVDLLFLRKYMPHLAALFPHVVVDVSSIKALCLRWYPKDAERAPPKKKSHRALEDIKESIAELKYMQKAIFKDSKR